MYNNNTNNFPAIVFMVVLFIGVGLLIYYAWDVTQTLADITLDNEALRTQNAEYETLIADLQARIATYEATISTYAASLSDYEARITLLMADQAGHQAEIDRLNAEIARLEAELENARNDLNTLTAAQNASLTVSEHQPLSPDSPCEQTAETTGIVLSAGFWTTVSALSIAEFILVGWLLTRKMRRDNRPNAAHRLAANSLPRKSTHNHVIDSRFTDR